MASSKLTNVKLLLSTYTITGLESDEKVQEVFCQYCASTIGELDEKGDGVFNSLKISGKNEKAKTKLNRGTVEVVVRAHTTAHVVIAAACLMRDLEVSINQVVGKADVRDRVKLWHDNWSKKVAERKATKEEEEEEEEEANA